MTFIPLLLGIALAQLPFAYLAAWWLNSERLMWKGKFEALEAESKVVYKGHVDASFQKTTGRPLFHLRDENPQEAGSTFQLGSDMVESERLKALAGMPKEEDYWTPEDELHLSQFVEKEIN